MDGHKEAELSRRLDCLEEDLTKSAEQMRQVLEQIRGAVVGSLDGQQEGLLSRTRRLEEQVVSMKEMLKGIQGDNDSWKLDRKFIALLTTVGLAGIWKLVDLVIWIIRHK